MASKKNNVIIDINDGRMRAIPICTKLDDLLESQKIYNNAKIKVLKNEKFERQRV